MARRRIRYLAGPVGAPQTARRGARVFHRRAPTVDLARMSDGSNHLFLVRQEHPLQLRSMISGVTPVQADGRPVSRWASAAQRKQAIGPT
jgi:hypothetical protein